MSDIVLKILSCDEWAGAQRSGIYHGAEIDLTDGFIHFSTPGQVRETAARHFRNQTALVVVAFRAGDLGSDLKWENSRGGDLFPHLYGNLDPALALWSADAPLDDEGVPIIPQKAFEC